jgi:hypothetical protein
MDQSSLMPTAPNKIPENIDFAAQEMREAPAADRPAMLEGIAKALTRRLLHDNPGIGAQEASERVTAFVNAVRDRLG